MNPQYSERLLTTSGAAVIDSSRPQAVLHAAYDAIIKGDFDAFSELVAEDVELNIHGFGPMNGSWRGRGDVVEATRNNFALVDDQQPEIESMISQGDSVAVLMRESGVFKSSGQAYSIRCVQWFTVVNGKIKRIDETVADV